MHLIHTFIFDFPKVLLNEYCEKVRDKMLEFSKRHVGNDIWPRAYLEESKAK